MDGTMVLDLDVASEDNILTTFHFRRNPQTKKHKTWDGDGVLVSRSNGESTLYNIDGKM